MTRKIALICLVVPDYDQAIAFYVGALGFSLVEDRRIDERKRWVVVAPEGPGSALLLAKADGPQQQAAIGMQTGGRVFLFLETDNFDRDAAHMQAKNVEFLENPRHEVYGKVAVFRDPFGNKWDLIERSNA